jgi:hypothetical protein
MPNNYAIPGVYVEEIPKFPPSVAQVETAIPAFIGYTQKALDTSGNSLAVNTPVRITSFTEFETRFGAAPPLGVSQIRLDASDNFVGADITTAYYLHHAVQLFYANGGGDCYIVSVGPYATAAPFADETHFTNAGAALEAISRVDEPTILLFPDAVLLDDAALGNVQKAALLQCANLQDRVTVCDLKNDSPADLQDIVDFRQQIGINNLKYGAAYTPWIAALLPKNIGYAQLNGNIFVRAGALPMVDLATINTDADIANVLNNYDLILAINTIGTIGALRSDINDEYASLLLIADYDTATMTSALDGAITAMDTAVAALVPGTIPVLPANYSTALTNLQAAVTAYEALTNASTPAAIATGRADLATAMSNYLNFVGTTATANAEENLRAVYPIYRAIIAGLNGVPLAVPPSGAIVGVYAAVDRTRGVWKAPANVSLNQVVGPTKAYVQSALANLNVDPSTGKSINAIRSFTGKGTLVWGARTLAGNDNEWRYISVRRFVNMVEESTKKAAEQFVFEPNDANTWVRVQAMIENFLTLQWRAGALQGAKQEQAFRVAVGLGKTMTADDILNGRMIVQIALAIVRPAEFIVLRFEQMMPQS